MAQTNYTPISLYYSTTAAAVPVNTNLVNGELAINITDGKLYYKNNGGTVTLLASTAGASGDVVGPASATDNALARFDTTTGKLIQNSVGILSDAGVLTGLTGITSSGSITFSSLTSGRVTYATTAGLLTDSANLLYSGTDLTVYGITVGRGAGAVSTNTAVGGSALAANTSGATNVAIGYQAGQFNTTGNDNVSMGVNALRNTTTGASNTALGRDALVSNTTASNNTAVGYQAAYSNTTGAQTTAIGYRALYTNTTETFNTAVGYQTLYSNIQAFNVAVGDGAGYANTTGGITAIGSNVLLNNTTGQANVAIGGRVNGVSTAAMVSNTTGSYNTGLGVGALQANTTASRNTAVGYQAAYSNTTAPDNTAVGYQAAFSNTTGDALTAMGRGALYANTTGVNSVAIGYYALNNNTTGTNNVAVGLTALQANTTASNNTAVGYQAGYGLTTGSNNTYLGYSATQSGVAVTGEIVLCAASTIGKGSNTGYINTSGGVYQGNNSAAWSITSDQRLKKNIVDNTDGLSKIEGIRIRNFEYRLPEEINSELKPTDAIKKPGVQLGVIAQELQQVLPDCVKQESTGVLSVDSDNLTWYLINAVKELSAEVDSLKSQLNGVQP